jgi:glycosyltransferase involved in cell wall biosynthesis
VPPAKDEFAKLYDLCRRTSGVEYHGSVAQRTLALALCESDILAYPSVFAETSCISVVEAASAGCAIVSTDLGALAETGSGFAYLLPVPDPQRSDREFVLKYAEHVVEFIETSQEKPAEFRQKLEEQMTFFQERYSWARRAEEWEAFFEKIVR